MGQIQVTPAELKNQAQNLRGLNNQFKAKVSSLVETEGSLIAMWEGDAKTSFHAAFSNDQMQMDNFYNLMEQYITALENTAIEYSNKEAMNAEIASRRSY